MKGKYGLVGSADDDNDRVLVGPNYFSEARLANKGFDAYGEGVDADQEEIEAEPELERKYEKTEKYANKEEKVGESYQNQLNEKQVEPTDSDEAPYPLIPPSLYNWFPQLNYLPPISAYVPVPYGNQQYLQRRNFNPYRYPMMPTPYANYQQSQYNQQPYNPYNPYYVM